MMKQTSIGEAEELINTLLNAVAAEYHARITYEKYWSLINVKGIPDVQEELETRDKMHFQKQLLEKITTYRRNVMTSLYEVGDEGNKDLWCTLKHLAEVMETSFEVWQTDLSDARKEDMYHDSVELFNLAVSEFLGFVPVTCSACLADAMEQQQKFDATKEQVNAADDNDKTAEDVIKKANELFGVDVSEELGK